MYESAADPASPAVLTPDPRTRPTAHAGTAALGAKVFALAAVVVASLVFAGWLFDVPLLRGGEPAMQPITAAMMTLAAIAALAVAGPASRRSRWVSTAAGLLLLAAAIAEMHATLTGRALPLDTLLLSRTVRDQPWSAITVPGRVATGTALGFLLMALAALLPAARWSSRRLRSAVATLSLVLAATAALGFAFSLPSLQHVRLFTGVAAPAALGLVLLSLAMLLAHPGDSWMGRMLGDPQPSRYVTPVAACVLIPLAIAGLAVAGQRLDYYDADFRLVLTTVGTAAALVCALWAARRWASQSESLLAAIVASSSDAIVTTSPTGRLTSWNPAAERMFGYRAADALRESVLFFTPIDRQDEWLHAVAQCLQHVAVPPFDTQRLRRDGTRVDVSVAIAAIRDADGQCVGTSAVLRDITERRRHEQLLRDSEERFRATFELAPVGIAHVGLDGRWLRVNDRVCAITGRSREALLGLTFQSVTHPDDLPGFDTQSRAVLAGEVPSYARHKRYLRPDGSEVWVSITVSLQRDADGRPVHYITVVEDISERMRIDAELRHAHRQKDEFLAMLAHELRNPLAPIGNAGALLARMAADDPRLAQPAAIVNRQTRQLSRLVDDLLDVSRIAQGRVQLRRETLPLAQVIEQAIEETQPLIDAKYQQLALALSPAPLYVDGDRARLAQTVGNVLQNAAKYTQSGGHIAIALAVEGHEAVIRITDDGPGIEPELLPHLFDIFVQSRRTLDRAHGGLGIGLSLCRSLLTMHGGSIEASSDGAQRGATFTIRLPQCAPPAPGTTPHQPPPGPPRRVLVVDDNADAADSLAMLLRLGGHEVDTANDPREAMDAALRLRPDVVFLDIGLPEIDGYEVARRMRADPRLDGTRLVALTGYGQAADRALAREAGFDDHLLKPADPQVLQRLLDERRRGRERPRATLV